MQPDSTTFLLLEEVFVNIFSFEITSISNHKSIHKQDFDLIFQRFYFQEYVNREVVLYKFFFLTHFQMVH